MEIALFSHSTCDINSTQQHEEAITSYDITMPQPWLAFFTIMIKYKIYLLYLYHK